MNITFGNGLYKRQNKILEVSIENDGTSYAQTLSLIKEPHI